MKPIAMYDEIVDNKHKSEALKSKRYLSEELIERAQKEIFRIRLGFCCDGSSNFLIMH